MIERMAGNRPLKVAFVVGAPDLVVLHLTVEDNGTGFGLSACEAATASAAWESGSRRSAARSGCVPRRAMER